MVLIRDIAGDATQKATEHLRPSQEQLAQIDEPAEANVWHDKPDFSKENIKSQIKSRGNQNKPAVSALHSPGLFT